MVKEKVRNTPENITVYPLDMARLNEDIDKLGHKDKAPDNIRYETRGGGHALIRQPKLCIINDEFIGSEVKEEVTFYVYTEKTHLDGGKSFSCIPESEVTLSLAEVEQYLLPATTLAEFTKERRGYNSRIRSNEGEWMAFLNGEVK